MVRWVIRREEKVRVSLTDKPKLPEHPSLDYIEERFRQIPRTTNTTAPFREQGLITTVEEQRELADKIKYANVEGVKKEFVKENKRQDIAGMIAVGGLILGGMSKGIEAPEVVRNLGLVLAVVGSYISVGKMIAAMITNITFEGECGIEKKVELANKILEKSSVTDQETIKLLREIAQTPILEASDEIIERVNKKVYKGILLAPIVFAAAVIGIGSRMESFRIENLVGIAIVTTAIVITLGVARAINTEKKPFQVRFETENKGSEEPLEVELEERTEKRQGTK